MPLNVRGKGMALAAAANMLANIVIGDYGVNWLQSPDVLGTVGTWWFLFGLNAIWTAPFVLFILPETKELSLEEMHFAFNYTFGGSNELGTFTEYMGKNFGQALDIFRCKGADVRAGFEMRAIAKAEGSDRSNGNGNIGSSNAKGLAKGHSSSMNVLSSGVQLTQRKSMGKMI